MTTKTFLKKINSFIDIANSTFGYHFELKITDWYFKVFTHGNFITCTLLQYLPHSLFMFMSIDTDVDDYIVLSFQKGQFM